MPARTRGLLRETTGVFGAGALLVLPAALGMTLLAGDGAAEGRIEIRAEEATPLVSAAIQPTAPTDGEVPALDARARQEARAALTALSDEELALTARRIHAAFRHQLGASDLRPARALIDYAQLTEQEMGARGLPWPEGLPDAAEMRHLFALVL